jgi:vacuolar-type H+-ATPase subunit E/Vma4
MIELDNRAEQFLNSIREEGEQECAAIKQQTRTMVDAELAKANAEEQAGAEKTVAFERSRSEAAANRELSAARAKMRAELSVQRDAITRQVFAAAGKKLTAFVQSADYAAWLQKSAAALAAKTGSGSVLYARPADLPLLQGKVPQGCTLQADSAIALGGLRAAGGAVAADDTLDARLESQKDWFLEHSGLSIEA